MDTRAREPEREASGGAEPLAWPEAQNYAGRHVAGWEVAAGLTDLGPATDSGLQHRTYLVRRADGQVIQLSELLYLVLGHLDPAATTVNIADNISIDFGRRLSPDGLRHLVEERLAPLGLVTLPGDAPQEAAPRARPLLSLTFRGTLLPAGAVRFIARGLTWFFFPPVVIVLLGAFVATDLALWRRGDLLGAFEELIATPTMLLLILLVINCAALVHELGHAAACRYGGAVPGRIGYGVYIVYPAYFTEV